ncbi:hypothetical protein NZD89_15290 [Alicyclobacillus fastidiosus]|uniref:PglD N-terminal domain-containing protein n=1 Tax=Alicyclobacillus fastidiosus TaxID=392011 RepID=A0ABY6ZBZ0_9BACL|nr:hypothetical protein [Alicyclobacillus fastidiosus]WAH39771.1 hypothetical protein NZD89_15290 [Alicyclobacillus fastidiosus]GMA61013.1 hypothetical protein GCM10025859_14530 [Alicyclobacillus fastidiosus]
MDIAIFGAGGFAEEVADLCLELRYNSVVLIDKDHGVSTASGFPVVSEMEVDALRLAKYQFVIALGNPRLRRDVHCRFSILPFVNVVHPCATFGIRQKADLLQRKGNIVLAGARVTVNITFGNFGIYNQNCTVAHDCAIEDYVTIGPGANVSGNVRLLEGAYIGSGAVVLQGKGRDAKLSVGRYATVGAGAVVTKNVLDGHVVKGVPAR